MFVFYLSKNRVSELEQGARIGADGQNRSRVPELEQMARTEQMTKVPGLELWVP